MTVSLAAKTEVQKSDDNENVDCCIDRHAADYDHTESLLQNCIRTEENDIWNQEKNRKSIGDDETNIKRLFTIEEVPEFIRHNPYILSGYRGILNAKSCIESIFWWTNETINIWSHIFGYCLFVALTINDLIVLRIDAPFLDKFMVAMLLFSFQTTMIVSVLYHTFSCRSEEDMASFLCFDLLGIALSLLSIYTSGVYYAFWCHQGLRQFYLLTVTLIFILAMSLQIPSFNVDTNIKMATFVSWAAYGVIPTLHWTISMGGLENPMVRLFLPRVIGMYTISGTAFLIYITKLPERFFAGKFDFLGHSHQWWHMLVVLALYYWHSTGMMYVEYRMNHTCVDNFNYISYEA
ncbi:progestin and adipoQ receptor family member 3 isoform X2 [Agrilus planipennis]|uniref:Progestin and adipoQ receptor family member 3 isoform X2 n=1 Tax=Agrilus planipennis TaxID=224129 RepID=A0A7F5QW02_AGRPL|nr:progestin and adipoQ receptor family member 3 isoform X2 [Agrilus planipennis]